jgi:hypothetical protein
MKSPPIAVMRAMAALIILLNTDIALGALLAAGYGLVTALTAVGAFGAVTAEIVVRLLPGDPNLPSPPLSR